jgi:aerobic carbon-monoxide dehydrogenase medium subunit
MKPHAFDYHDPAAVSDVLGLLAEHAGRARVLAGGQSLLPLINARLVRPGVLVDINGVEELNLLTHGADGLTIGATLRQRDLERSDGLAELNPLLAEAVPLIGHFQVRNRGTVCGSLAFANPAGQLPAAAVTLGARLTLASTGGRRVVAARGFFLGNQKTCMEPDELLTHVNFPAWRRGDGWAVEQVTRRHNDFALAGSMVLVTAEGGVVRDARVTVYGAGLMPQRARAAEGLLRGVGPSRGLLDAFAQKVRGEVEAHDDVQAPADYRRHLAGVLASRALVRAAARAGLRPEGFDE